MITLSNRNFHVLESAGLGAETEQYVRCEWDRDRARGERHFRRLQGGFHTGSWKGLAEPHLTSNFASEMARESLLCVDFRSNGSDFIAHNFQISRTLVQCLVHC